MWSKRKVSAANEKIMAILHAKPMQQYDKLKTKKESKPTRKNKNTILKSIN